MRTGNVTGTMTVPTGPMKILVYASHVDQICFHVIVGSVYMCTGNVTDTATVPTGPIKIICD